MNKLTPREPTLEMQMAAKNAAFAVTEQWHSSTQICAIWRAMHDAAPTVQADATPELLKAVRSVIAWYEAEDDHSKADFYKRLEMCRESETLCRAAIAKAEGHPAAPQPEQHLTQNEQAAMKRALFASAKDVAPQPAGEVVVTKNESGQIVAVTRQDEEGRILSVIAESDAPPPAALPEPTDKLREALAAMIDLCEFWINRENRGQMSDEEYRTWHALGHGSNAMANARAALKGKQ